MDNAKFEKACDKILDELNCDNSSVETLNKMLEHVDMNDIDTKNIIYVFSALVKLQNDKAKLYGRSYCKYGDIGVFMNLSRKWDRIDNIMHNAMNNGVDKVLHSGSSSTATETFVDTVADMATYSLLWLGYIKETHPDEWERFLDNNNI